MPPEAARAASEPLKDPGRVPSARWRPASGLKSEKAMTPNLPQPMRIAYFAIGVILVVSPLLLNLHPWIRVGAPIMGVLAIINAATGW